jgi:DNA relaxase NicK
MMTTITPVFCDWVTSVAPTIRTGRWLRLFLERETTDATYKAYHRTHGVKYYPSGIKHYHSPHDLDIGSVLVIDGQSMNNLRTVYDNDGSLKVVSILARCSSHFSRIDLAMDIMDGGELAKKFAVFSENNILDFGRRKSRTVRESGTWGGTTTYVGSRTSPKYLRVYDKSAESKGVVPASRIEFEIKAEAAEEVTSILSAFDGHLKASSLFVGLLGQFTDWTDFPEVEAIRYGEVTIIDVHHNERLLDRKEWLRRQVLPTFTKNPNGEGGELWAWMVETVGAARLGA